jgi:NTE family protein
MLGLVRLVTCLLLVCLVTLPVLAAAAPAEAVAVERPRIGLVLSGGGARGAAHVGVLKVLEQRRIPIDAIAGTSMGAVIGGLYASGLDAAAIAALVDSEEWRAAFREPAPRERSSFRRKSEDQNFLVKFPLGLKGGSFRLPKGLISSQRLNQLLRRVTLPAAVIEDFDALPTPFRAVATDLESGEAVELAGRDLVEAMRASLAAPGLFEPVSMAGRLLVDGGLANNLPVDVARRMGVDILIVVDVGFPLRTRDSLDSVTRISNQMLSILIRRGSDAQRRAIGEQDILLSPALGEASSFDFDILPVAVRSGEEAALAASERLDALALGVQAYEQYRARRLAVLPALGAVEDIRVADSAQRYERLLSSEAAAVLALDGQIDQAVTTLFGRGNFESVDYRLSGLQGERLELSAQRNSWGPNYVRFGLNIEDDFSGNSSYNAAARFVLADISSLGAEWVWDLQVGSSPRVATELYWPLGPRAQWFVMPQARFEQRSVPVLLDQQPLAEYRVRTKEYGIDIGREFGNVAELRGGLRRVTGDSRLRLGEPTGLPGSDFDVREFFARFSIDQLDDRNFPRSGQYLLAEWRGERTDLGSARGADLLGVDWLAAKSFGRHTAVVWNSFGSNLDSATASVRTLYTLGGFLNLSGLAPGSLSGRHYAITRLLYYRQIGRGGEGFLNVPAYAGLSFEAGNVWEDRGHISFGSARKQGSVFLGFDTLFGPVYLGGGYGEGGDSAFYLFLGRTF